MSLYLLLLLLLLLPFTYSDTGKKCLKANITLPETHLSMLQHQLRGTISPIDGCSFFVKNFDMLSGQNVHFWAANAPDFENLTNGFVLSDMKLNKTYKNDTFLVHLNENVTWENVSVLSVWDVPTASDFGHILLPNVANSTNLTDFRVLNVPTMFDNCKVLADNYRVRWSLNVTSGMIELGLEAATGVQNYMAFGWADPRGKSEGFMIGGDVAVTGFKEDGTPFADDFYITKFSECMINENGEGEGVCPDIVFNTEGLDVVNNTEVVYGHRRDGVSLIRFKRPLVSNDTKFDVGVSHVENMTVIWSMGLIKPPDSLNPYYLPQNHGGTFGHLVLNVSQRFDDCFGPLDADNKEDQDVITADGNTPIVVSSGPALHYPNPPNPSKVIYINKKEAPVLKVERGVPVKFSIQAGHDVAFYVTSDPLGGNATMRNMSEIVYAGGSETEGVQSSPMELIWAPDRNTPDQVYYHSAFTQKMGWKVQVVDGGLSDMYNNSVFLDDQQVTLFWTLAENSISFAVRGEKKSGYLAIGFGSEMLNSFAYVAWVDDEGRGQVNTYWIDGREASNIHATSENLTYVRCKSENGIIMFEFTRPLIPPCDNKENPVCRNIIDPTTPLKIIWAMGARWSADHLSGVNMHSVTSSRPVRVLLISGSAEADEDLRPVLAVHGFMMFLAWGILLPGGILSARYLKHVKGDGWYKLHVYLQYSGLAIVLIGFLFAVAELQGLYIASLHVKFGLTAIFFACIQPVNAYLRPEKPANGEQPTPKRVGWEYLHVIVGRGAFLVGIAALFSGMKHLGDRYGAENVHGLQLALIFWFFVGALLVIYLEYRERQRLKNRTPGMSNWVLGNSEEDSDLLSPNQAVSEKEPVRSSRMEVQLEPISRR